MTSVSAKSLLSTSVNTSNLFQVLISFSLAIWKFDDLQVSVFSINISSEMVSANAILASTSSSSRGLCYRQPEPGTPTKVDP